MNTEIVEDLIRQAFGTINRQHAREVAELKAELNGVKGEIAKACYWRRNWDDEKAAREKYERALREARSALEFRESYQYISELIEEALGDS